MRPAGFEEGKRYPVLLFIHGGPYTQYVSSFFDEFQVYSGAGYAVVFANPRGSSGYSEDWGTAIRGPLNDARPGLGHRRLRGPDGGRWTRRSSVSTSSTRSARACSAARTAAT